MTILDKIIVQKRKEVENGKQNLPVATLVNSPLFHRSIFSMKKGLEEAPGAGIIAEFKRKSPSKGLINGHAVVEDVTTAYIAAGAIGLSVLTDVEFFGGSNENLLRARQANNSPILRKEFIVDEYQLLEARALGADAILLIAECLDKKQVFQLAKFAKELGLEVLMEIHSEDQLEKLNPYLDMVGVNNRNLKDFSVSIDTSLDLFDKIPDDFVKISESGLDNARAIATLSDAGFRGFLIGEYFMKQEDPGLACKTLIEDVSISLSRFKKN
ncbi:MAG: indole-3-glycerol phosphate synthase TrpC [Saprospiraceae bacterium]|nr:indole-3-glycerol phosphate synthase TrpC [Saprospiraceae bacterium]MCB9322206.1 indole-3-glycerol phosphate synthase TrpC [Lewinellaceae bacterium]